GGGGGKGGGWKTVSCGRGGPKGGPVGAPPAFPCPRQQRRRWRRSRSAVRWPLISGSACASPPPGPFNRRARSSTPCITIAAQWLCLRKTRSNDGCETSTRSRNKARDGYCTMKRWVRSSLAYHPRTSSDFGHSMPVASVSSLLIQRHIM